MSAAETVAPQNAETKTIRYTAPVRRGLAIMRAIFVISTNPDTPCTHDLVQGLKPAAKRDLDAALAWTEQESLAAYAPGTLTPTPISCMPGRIRLTPADAVTVVCDSLASIPAA